MNLPRETLLCTVCNQPVNLAFARAPNTAGKAVHEDCGAKKLTKKAVLGAHPKQSNVRLLRLGGEMSNGHPTLCYICDQPVDAAVERYAENGKPIHEMCYIQRQLGEIIPSTPNGSMPQTPTT